MISADPEIGPAVLRKAAWRLIPILGAGYAVALIDRTNLSFAALQMNRDLHFSASTYGLGAGIFFLSYAGCNVPANLMLLRFGARRWLAAIMLAWGIFSASTILVRSPGPFYALRFLLGVAEAGFFPGVIYYLTRWFPAQMRARAITRFYVFGPLSGVVTGSIAGALLNLQGRLGLAGWQWLFLIEALPALLLSGLIFMHLPDAPESAAWLSPGERDWLMRKLGEEGGRRPARNPAAGFLRAFRQRKVWLAGLFMFCAMFGFYAYIFFAPAVVEQLTGFGATGVGFVIAAQFVVSSAAMVLNGAHSDRHRERYLHTIIPCLLTVAGFLVGALSRSPWIAIPALTLVPACQWAAQGPSWAACTALLQGDAAAAGIAAITSLGILGGFAGPQMLGALKDLTGDYRTGLLLCSVPCLVSILFMRALARSPKNQTLLGIPGGAGL